MEVSIVYICKNICMREMKLLFYCCFILTKQNSEGISAVAKGSVCMGGSGIPACSTKNSMLCVLSSTYLT